MSELTSQDLLPPESESAEAIYAYAFVVDQIAAGHSALKMEDILVEDGLDRKAAREIIRRAMEEARQIKTQAAAKAGPWNVVLGVGWIVGGAGMTGLSYYLAMNGGGVYHVFWAAAVFGALQLLRGVMQLTGKALEEES